MIRWKFWYKKCDILPQEENELGSKTLFQAGKSATTLSSGFFSSAKMLRVCQVDSPNHSPNHSPKKMQHSDLYLISVLEAGFYFFTYVLESEFLACFISTLKQCPFWILIALIMHARIFFPAISSAAWTVSSLHHQSKPNLSSVLAGTTIQELHLT